MSPPARALLALAAAALLHAAACVCPSPCTVVKGGDDGKVIDVADYHLYVTETVQDLPPDQCGQAAIQVGVRVTVCDPDFGSAPAVQLVDDDRRVHITCTWTDDKLCAHGLDVNVQQMCRTWLP